MSFANIIKTIIPSQLLPAARKVKSAINPPPSIIADLIKAHCKGQGLEIGPGKNPYCGNALHLDRYSDNEDAANRADLLCDATDIAFADESFDFVLSSHCLEHIPNTLAALFEWQRILKNHGILFLILPHGDRTFDKHREKTQLAHHVEDFENLSRDPDLSHIEEIKAGWSELEDFNQQKAEYENKFGVPFWDWDFRIKQGIIHYHVWTQNEMIEILRHVGFSIVCLYETVPERPDSFLILARK